MKNILSALLILFAINAYTQIPDIVWQKCYGSPELDESYGIISKGDELLIAIHLLDSIPGVTNYHGKGDIWIINTDSTGNIIWEKCFGGSKGDVPWKLIKKSEDEFFIFGVTASTDGVVICPADATEEVKALSHHISHLKGGEGCVRDIIEQVLKVQGNWLDDDAFIW
jgi:hypothetical protein